MAEKEKLRQEFLDELQNRLVRASCTDEIYALLAEAAAWLTASEGLSFFIRREDCFEQVCRLGKFPEMEGVTQAALFGGEHPVSFETVMIGKVCLQEKEDGVFMIFRPKPELMTAQNRECLQLICGMGALVQKELWIRGKAHRDAMTDEITGALNRSCLLQRLQEDMGTKIGNAALIDINVDGFKLYNEMYGYMNSDALLKFVADAIRREKTGQGEIYRFGADEFLLLEPDMTEEQAFDTAERIRRRIRDSSREKKDLLHQLTVSCGIVIYPEYVEDKEELLGCCVRAAYYAKTRGKDQTALWRKEDRPRERSGYYRTSFERIAPTIYALMAAVDAKDQITFRHSLKVSEYATLLAQALELKEEEVEIIREAGLLHDIGKIGIPESILKKQGRLTEAEYMVMKEHVENAVEMIRYLPDMNYVLPTVVGHHERYDGKGYPAGLAGEAIPLGARCLALADSFDTMTARRPYKEPMQISYAVKELEKGKNTQFDPYLTDVFLRLIEEGEIQVWGRGDD